VVPAGRFAEVRRAELPVEWRGVELLQPPSPMLPSMPSKHIAKVQNIHS
jgi:hypothetical protein